MTDISVQEPRMSAAMQLAELRVKRPLAEFIREEYVEKGRMQREVAADLGTDTSTLSRWMRELGIRARRRGNASIRTAFWTGRPSP